MHSHVLAKNAQQKNLFKHIKTHANTYKNTHTRTRFYITMKIYFKKNYYGNFEQKNIKSCYNDTTGIKEFIGLNKFYT